MVSREKRTALLEQIFPAGGELGSRMRELDWSMTALGPVEAWEPALRTAVSIVLASPYPIVALWGPEYVQLYNDAFRPILGEKHPSALGLPASRTYQEVWSVIEPMYSGVMRTGVATYSQNQVLFLVRQGFAEEAYFTWSYIPVQDEKGARVGLLALVSEVTSQVLGERRIRTLSELSIRTAQAVDVSGVLRGAQEVLEQSGADLPFGLIYGVEGETGNLVLRSGLAEGHPAAPSSLALSGPAPVWKLEEILRSGEAQTVALQSPVQAGPWPEPVQKVLMLPLDLKGASHADSVLILGLSPRLPQDEAYLGFLRLLSRQLAADVARARSLAEEKRRAAQLAELDRQKTKFFSNVSHEFRTPLTLMLGPLEELSASSRVPDSERTQLVAVLRNSRRLLKLVNTLLDFSRIEAGRMAARFEPTELASLTAGLASAFDSVVTRAGMRLHVDCPPLPERIWVDTDMWEKVVLNLVSNAFKFTLAGEIWVQLRWRTNEVELLVRDTGAGIPQAELPRIFERFYRPDGVQGRSHEGSGIGLALVQELVKLHGGSISVESAPGSGSTFKVTLPAGSGHLPAQHVSGAQPLRTTPVGQDAFLEEVAQWQAEPPHKTGDVPVASTVEGRILLVDDNADMRAYLKRTLEGPFVVEGVSDGLAALEAARRHPPDLVVSDVMMPGLDGFGLVRELKRDPRTAHVPVILLSARVGEEATVEGLAAGAADYLVKPFSARELRARVEGTVRTAQAKRERERLLADIEAARHRLNSLFEKAPAFVCTLRGPDHVFEMANPTYRRVVGMGRPLIGLPLKEALPEVVPSGFIEILDGVLRTGEPYVGRETFTHFDRRDDGTFDDAYVTFVYQPMRSPSGQIEGVDVFGFEVTDQVVARKKAESLSAELQAADRRKDEFLAMLAHELRNPLAAISTSLSMLERTEGDETRMAKHRETARRQVGNLVRLVDDLLDVSRITRGVVELRKDALDLPSLVQNAVEATRAAMDARGHRLTVTLGPGPYHLEGDATRLEQVFVNLLTNAAKYTDPGGTVMVQLQRLVSTDGQPQASLRVRDSGQGIPPEMLERVFELFVQVSSTIDRTAGGLGLGLTLVRRLVEMHGGQVQARSDGPGRGSEFEVRLPLSASNSVSAPEPAGAELPPLVASGRCRILLIEDSEDIRESLLELLESLGHDVTVAANGPDGLAKLISLRPDVALVDVGLPGMDGFEVARRSRAEPGGASPFLVAVTGYGGLAAKEKAAAAGFDLHLTKPIDIDDLARILSRSRPAASM